MPSNKNSAGERTPTPSPPIRQARRRPAKENKFLRERATRRRNRKLLGALAVSLLVVGAAAALFTAGPGPKPVNDSLHQHPNLEIYVQGELVPVPPNLGIDPNLWNDHSMDAYGEMASMSPIHTHDSSGVIHLEMGRWHACTLGNLFDVWGQPFDRNRILSHAGPVNLTVDGNPSEEYRDLVLQDGQRIVIRAG